MSDIYVISNDRHGISDIILLYRYRCDIDRYIGQISLRYRMVVVVSNVESQGIGIDPTSVAILALYQNSDIKTISKGKFTALPMLKSDIFLIYMVNIILSTQLHRIYIAWYRGRYGIAFIETISKWSFYFHFHVSRICLCSWPISIWHWMTDAMEGNSILPISFPSRALYRTSIVPSPNGWRRFDNVIVSYRYPFDEGRYVGQT